MDAVAEKVLPPARRRPVDLPYIRWKKIVFPSEPQEDMLTHLCRYHYLLLSQIVNLQGSSHTSAKYVQRKHIKPLVTAGWLYEQCLSRKSRAGSLPIVYSLATKGRNYMQYLGHTFSTHPTPSEQEKSYGYLLHTLEVNNVLMLPHLLSRSFPQVTLKEFRHDLDMQRRKPRLPDLNGKRRFLVPDGYWDFLLAKPFRTETMNHISFVVEVDRGMLNVYDFRDRIRDYCDFVYGAFQSYFNSNSFTILWVTTAGAHRVAWMRHHATSHLKALHKPEHARYHRFLTIPPLFQGCIDPKMFFFAPVWLTLDNDTPIPLFKRKG